MSTFNLACHVWPIIFVLLLHCISSSPGRLHFSKYYHMPFPDELRGAAANEVRAMFDHSFDGYMKYAFPHDELKAVTGTFTDSLPELGNAKNQNRRYKGLALTLIDSLDSLLLFNRTQSFIDAHAYLSTALPNPMHRRRHRQRYANSSTAHIFSGFNVDIRVHLFETNIRMLGGLLSAHSLCTHPKWTKLLFQHHPEFIYDNEFLTLAQDLGNRLLPAFNTTNFIPYAWVNLRRGVLQDETRDTCSAGVGTLMLEMALLSYHTRNSTYFLCAHRALLKLFRLRHVDSHLLPNSFNGGTLRHLNGNAGIGAGIDSFYEYLLKSYMYLGYDHYWDMFQIQYRSALKYLRKGPWYVEANTKTSKTSHFHFNSLQAFWPSLQILVGDVPLSLSTINAFFSIWFAHNGMPERFLLNSNQAHSTENHYPLRPELIESILYAFQALKHNQRQMNRVWPSGHHAHAHAEGHIHADYFLWLGYEILQSLQNRTRTQYGYTILNNVITGEQGDYMPSYFLAETCKYLLLLFDETAVLHSRELQNEYIFTTEGHVFPVYADMREYIERVLRAEPGVRELEDELRLPYQDYAEFWNSGERDDDDEADEEADLDEVFIFEEDEGEVEQPARTTSQSQSQSQSRQQRLTSTYNARSIIGSSNIESIFIPQPASSAVCPASPFYYYWRMHHDKDEVVYSNNNRQATVASTDTNGGMGYLWQLVRKMFGKKEEMYGYRDKQISTIAQAGDGSSNLPIGDQCAMPSQTSANQENNANNHVWQLSNNHRIRVSHDIGHFTVHFDDHSEKLEIFNLGTNFVEMTNAVPIASTYSSFHDYLSPNPANLVNPKYAKQYDVSIAYLFDSVGPTRYEIRLKTASLRTCYKQQIRRLLIEQQQQQQQQEQPIKVDVDVDDESADTIAVKASSAYFRPQPLPVTVEELDSTDTDDTRRCHLERVLGAGSILHAAVPSTSCSFPENLARLIEEREMEPQSLPFIMFVDRGGCTFYDKVSILEQENAQRIIGGVIVGNVNENGYDIFTMGSDGTETPLDLPAFMINKLSYHALTKCAHQLEDTPQMLEIELVEVMTRCEEQTISDLNIHGVNQHFYISSLSNSDFVVTQSGETFKLSLPE